MSVAESIVILGPMVHTGCWSASLTDALESSPLVHPRNGPPEPVSTTRFRSSRRSPRRARAKAACSESTGSSRSGSPLIRSITSSPPTTRLSLLASASVLPLWSAASVGPRPAEPTRPFTTTSASDSRATVSVALGPMISSTPGSAPSFCLTSSAASSSAIATSGGRNSRTCPTNRSWLVPPADRPTTLNRSALRRTTSSACVPMEPVEPRMARDLIVSSVPRVRAEPGQRLLREDDAEQQERGRRHEEQRIDPVEHPSVARQDAPHVLDAQVSFDEGLGQVSEGGGRRYDQGERQ